MVPLMMALSQARGSFQADIDGQVDQAFGDIAVSVVVKIADSIGVRRQRAPFDKLSAHGCRLSAHGCGLSAHGCELGAHGYRRSAPGHKLRAHPLGVIMNRIGKSLR